MEDALNNPPRKQPLNNLRHSVPVDYSGLDPDDADILRAAHERPEDRRCSCGEPATAYTGWDDMGEVVLMCESCRTGVPFSLVAWRQGLGR